MEQMTYWAECVGYTPTMTAQLRTMAADCMGCAQVGRCSITAITIANTPESDSYVRGSTKVVIEWRRLAPQVALLTLTRAWAAMGLHTAGGNSWTTVTGPMGVTHLHLQEIWWQVERQRPERSVAGVIDHDGGVWGPN